MSPTRPPKKQGRQCGVEIHVLPEGRTKRVPISRRPIPFGGVLLLAGGGKQYEVAAEYTLETPAGATRRGAMLVSGSALDLDSSFRKSGLELKEEPVRRSKEIGGGLGLRVRPGRFFPREGAPFLAALYLAHKDESQLRAYRVPWGGFGDYERTLGGCPACGGRKWHLSIIPGIGLRDDGDLEYECRSRVACPGCRVLQGDRNSRCPVCKSRGTVACRATVLVPGLPPRIRPASAQYR